MRAFSTVIFSGGALRTLCCAGALQYLTDAGLLHGVHTYVSTSASAVMLYLYLIGYSPLQILDIVCTHDVLRRTFVLNWNTLLESPHCVSDFAPYIELLTEFTVRAGFGELTMHELYELTGVLWVVSVFNYTEQTLEYMSAQTHPDLKCLKLLEWTCAIPFVFAMPQYEGVEYMDAGCIESTPLGYAVRELVGEHVLVCLLEPYLYAGRESTHPRHLTLSHDIISLGPRILAESQLDALRQRCAVTCAHLTSLPHFLNFDISATEKLNMFMEGYSDCARALDVHARVGRALEELS